MAIERRVQRLLRQAPRGDNPSQLKQFLTDQLEAWPEPFPRLAKGLKQDYGCASEIAEQLAVLGHPAVPALLKALRRHSSPSAREAAATALGRLRATNAMTKPVGALRRDKSREVRAAATALGRVGDARAVKALAAALRGDSAGEVRRRAAEALGQIGGERAWAVLVHALQTDPMVRFEVVEGLGNLGATEGL